MIKLTDDELKMDLPTALAETETAIKALGAMGHPVPEEAYQIRSIMRLAIAWKADCDEYKSQSLANAKRVEVLERLLRPADIYVLAHVLAMERDIQDSQDMPDESEDLSGAIKSLSEAKEFRKQLAQALKGT